MHALPRRSIVGCFTPLSGIDSRSQALPGRANCGLMHRSKLRLFDHLVGGRDKIGRKRKPKRVGGSEIDDEIELR